MNYVIAGTGHRPNVLKHGYMSMPKLEEFAIEMLRPAVPLTKELISGMAQGWDMALAKAAIILGVPLVAAVPCVGQERMWPERAQAEYRDVLRMAKRVEVVCPGGYAAWKMQKRNEWMVAHCDRLWAFSNGDTTGGTANCLRYWRLAYPSKPMINFWDMWVAYEKAR